MTVSVREAICDLCHGARKRAIYRSDFTRPLFQTAALVDWCECVGGRPGYYEVEPDEEPKERA